MRFRVHSFAASLLQYERERLALWIPVLLGLGVAAYFVLPVEPWSLTGIVMLTLFVLLGIVGRRHVILWFPALVLGIVALGFFAAQLRASRVGAPVLPWEHRYRDVEGRIGDIVTKEQGCKLILEQPVIERVPPAKNPARLSVSFRACEKSWRVGDGVRVKATLYPPPQPSMPGGYDFARYFYFERIGALGYAVQAPEVTPLSHGVASDWLLALRHRIAGAIRDALPADTGPVAAALMVGEMSAIKADVADAMRDSGLSHILSVSGLHLALASGIVFFGVRLLLCLWPAFALRAPVKKIAASCALLSAFAYLMLAGDPVPAQRSFVMVACALLAVLVDRSGISVYALAWAAAIIVLAEPESMLGASFQMSFAATLAIITLYERHGDAFMRPGAGWPVRIACHIMGVMLTSFAATLATSPFVIYHFNRFSLWGIAANVLVLPIVSFWIMPMAVISFLLMPLGLDEWAIRLLGEGIGWMIACARWVSAMPHATMALPSLSGGGLALFVLGGLWFTLWKTRLRLLGIAMMTLGVATIAFYRPPDLLISGDGAHVALRVPDGRYAFVRGSERGFTGAAWLRAAGQEQMKGAPQAEAGIACEKALCRFKAGPFTVIVAKGRDAEQLPDTPSVPRSRGSYAKALERLGHALCAESAQMIIADFYLPRQGCAHVPYTLDKRRLHEQGATAYYFNSGGGIRIDTAALRSGSRPWNRYNNAIASNE